VEGRASQGAAYAFAILTSWMLTIWKPHIPGSGSSSTRLSPKLVENRAGMPHPVRACPVGSHGFMMSAVPAAGAVPSRTVGTWRQAAC